MDIACHTKNHPRMMNLTSDQLYDEIVYSKNVLTQMGFNVKTFVYPFGNCNVTIVDYVKDAGYVCARNTKAEVYRLKDPDPSASYHICSWQITNQSLDAFKQILSNATEDEVVVLTYHFLSDKASKEMYVLTQNFREQMMYLKENNFDVVLLPEFFAVDEEPSWLLPYWAVAIVGAGLAIVSVSWHLRLHKGRKRFSHGDGEEFRSVQLLFLKRRNSIHCAIVCTNGKGL